MKDLLYRFGMWLARRYSQRSLHYFIDPNAVVAVSAHVRVTRTMRYLDPDVMLADVTLRLTADLSKKILGTSSLYEFERLPATELDIDADDYSLTIYAVKINALI